MDRRPRLNLNDFVPLWERELPHPLHEPKFEGLIWRDVDIVDLAVLKDLIGDRTPLAQDFFRASVVRQSGAK